MKKNKTYQEKERQVANLQKRRREIEETVEYREWKKFILLPVETQNDIRIEWNNYYENVKKSWIYTAVQEQKRALANGDRETVRKIALQINELKEKGELETFKQPLGVDPWEFEYGPVIRDWKQINMKIKEIWGIIEEVATD